MYVNRSEERMKGARGAENFKNLCRALVKNVRRIAGSLLALSLKRVGYAGRTGWRQLSSHRLECHVELRRSAKRFGCQVAPPAHQIQGWLGSRLW